MEVRGGSDSHLSGGEGGGSNPTRLSRWSGTYSCTSTTLLMMLRSSCMAGMSGAYFHAPSTMNLYCASTPSCQPTKQHTIRPRPSAHMSALL